MYFYWIFVQTDVLILFSLEKKNGNNLGGVDQNLLLGSYRFV